MNISSPARRRDRRQSILNAPHLPFPPAMMSAPLQYAHILVNEQFEFCRQVVSGVHEARRTEASARRGPLRPIAARAANRVRSRFMIEVSYSEGCEKLARVCAVPHIDRTFLRDQQHMDSAKYWRFRPFDCTCSFSKPLCPCPLSATGRTQRRFARRGLPVMQRYLQTFLTSILAIATGGPLEGQNATTKLSPKPSTSVAVWRVNPQPRLRVSEILCMSHNSVSRRRMDGSTEEGGRSGAGGIARGVD
jgi:hypothetical protein